MNDDPHMYTQTESYTDSHVIVCVGMHNVLELLCVSVCVYVVEQERVCIRDREVGRS
jgi:hypothetical protein